MKTTLVRLHALTHRPLRGERGGLAVEYIGILVILAIVLALIGAVFVSAEADILALLQRLLTGIGGGGGEAPAP